mmetsp:Transcript_17138/g.65404  ORF Transcript_17138/g.65404 Transcript_17138/m.65404 type:complete len:228 (+) Transcript_17138:2067-2750(+)|eukprot:scaffold47_cov258-Pinguiococcus_pyrenoidosus.AAC.23
MPEPPGRFAVLQTTVQVKHLHGQVRAAQRRCASPQQRVVERRGELDVRLLEKLQNLERAIDAPAATAGVNEALIHVGVQVQLRLRHGLDDLERNVEHHVHLHSALLERVRVVLRLLQFGDLAFWFFVYQLVDFRGFTELPRRPGSLELHTLRRRLDHQTNGGGSIAIVVVRLLQPRILGVDHLPQAETEAEPSRRIGTLSDAGAESDDERGHNGLVEARVQAVGMRS